MLVINLRPLDPVSSPTISVRLCLTVASPNASLFASGVSKSRAIFLENNTQENIRENSGSDRGILRAIDQDNDQR
jgi:hypothetical protein